MSLPFHDLDAEAAVLSLALWGDLLPSTVRLLPEHFYSPDYGRLWALIGAAERTGHYEIWDEKTGRRRPKLPPLAGCLARLGQSRDGAATMIGDLLNWSTSGLARAATARPADYVRRVQDAARRRWLCRQLIEMEAAVRAGGAPDRAAVERVGRQLARLATVDGGGI